MEPRITQVEQDYQTAKVETHREGVVTIFIHNRMHFLKLFNILEKMPSWLNLTVYFQ